MPAKTARAPSRSAKSAKASHVGSARREAKASAKPSKKASRRAAQGIQHDDQPQRLDPTIHARKDGGSGRGAGGRRGGGKATAASPNSPGYGSDFDPQKYNAMKDILLEVLPNKPPGMTQGEMFDAVREAASNNNFPGSTHRSWAKSVHLDLEAKGVLVREPSTPLRWHIRSAVKEPLRAAAARATSPSPSIW